jgi:hypothetical protein
MLTNSTALNETSSETTLEMLARKKAGARELALQALIDELGHTDEEAARIVDDPVYTYRDLFLIPLISPMLKSDLLFAINSFYQEEPLPIELDEINTTAINPSCAEIFARMVERFPMEPVILNPTGNNPTVYENGHLISRGLVRRMLRAKEFKRTCEIERLAAQEFYLADALYVASKNARSFGNEFSLPAETNELDMAVFKSPSSRIGSNVNNSFNPYIKFIADANLNNLAVLGFMISVFGLCAFAALSRQTKCLQKSIVATIGIFKHCTQSRPSAKKHLESVELSTSFNP